jgi:hypothetical protein
MKGLGKGLVGVVTKPLAGISDFASSTLQGIEAQVCKTKPVRKTSMHLF